jgi:putative transposase
MGESVAMREQRNPKFTTFLSDWPVERMRHWVTWVNQPQTGAELEALRGSVNRGRPFGSQRWVVRVAKRLELESTLRPRGRPKGRSRA